LPFTDGKPQRTRILFSHSLCRKLTVDAETQANWKLLKTSFKAWRDDAVASRLEAVIEHRLLAKCFAYWMIQHRGVLLARVRDQRLVQDALVIWIGRSEDIRLNLEIRLRSAIKSRSSRAVQCAFEIWQEKIIVQNEKQALAIVPLWFMQLTCSNFIGVGPSGKV